MQAFRLKHTAAARTNATNILEKLYETGEYSDLKIVTSTQTFNVHKNVVCTASPFFAAACRNDWQEARTGIIKLPEDGGIIDILIKWCYGTLPEMIDCECKTWSECILHHLDIAVAADKYQIPDLKEALIRDLENWEGDFELWDDIEVGSLMYVEGRKDFIGPKFMRAVVEWIGSHIAAVMDDLELWQKLERCPELLKDVLRIVAQSSSVVEETWLLQDPDYLQDPENEDKGI